MRNGMKEYEIYRNSGYLDLVAVIKARSYEEAAEKAYQMGYDREYHSIQEVEDYG